jgi:hypothetical protein
LYGFRLSKYRDQNPLCIFCHKQHILHYSSYAILLKNGMVMSHWRGVQKLCQILVWMYGFRNKNWPDNPSWFIAHHTLCHGTSYIDMGCSADQYLLVSIHILNEWQITVITQQKGRGSSSLSCSTRRYQQTTLSPASLSVSQAALRTVILNGCSIHLSSMFFLTV